jgi:hypothetical protein
LTRLRATLTRSNHCLSRWRRTPITPLCAVWLVVLAALPFTAPFATLDLSDLFGGGHSQLAGTTFGTPGSITSYDDDSDDVVVSGSIQRAHSFGRMSLLPTASCPASLGLAVPAVVMIATSPPRQEPPPLPTVLRV